MSIRLYALTCGWMTVKTSLFLEGEPGTMVVPVPCYVIDHPRGLAVFDTGLHPALQGDPAARIGGLAKAFQIDFRPGWELPAQLASLDFDPRNVHYLINSHLHFDHAGGNEGVPDARLVVQRREWEAGHDADLAQANGLDRRDFDLGHDRVAVDGEHDVFGDGRVVCIPTFGHTPGHQSLRVRLDSSEVVLSGDACYLRRSLDTLHLPRVAHDREAMLRSLATLRRLRDAGARIFYGHDPEFWETLPKAPAALA